MSRSVEMTFDVEWLDGIVTVHLVYSPGIPSPNRYEQSEPAEIDIIEIKGPGSEILGSQTAVPADFWDACFELADERFHQENRSH